MNALQAYSLQVRSNAIRKPYMQGVNAFGHRSAPMAGGSGWMLTTPGPIDIVTAAFEQPLRLGL